MDKAYAAVPGVLTREVGGEMLLLNSDTELYFALNTSGAAMYELLIDGRSTEEVVAEIAERFGAERERVHGDLEALISTLESKGLIQSDG